MSIETGPTILPEAIYDELRALIIDQTYAPGVTITESAVALRFSVARPTAKMAIERLVTEGLLRREKHRAARVPQLDRDDIVDLFDNRAIVERAAVARLAESGILPPEAIAAHRALLESAASGTRSRATTSPFTAHSFPGSRARASLGCTTSSWARSNCASGKCRRPTF